MSVWFRNAISHHVTMVTWWLISWWTLHWVAALCKVLAGTNASAIIFVSSNYVSSVTQTVCRPVYQTLFVLDNRYLTCCFTFPNLVQDRMGQSQQLLLLLGRVYTLRSIRLTCLCAKVVGPNSSEGCASLYVAVQAPGRRRWRCRRRRVC